MVALLSPTDYQLALPLVMMISFIVSTRDFHNAEASKLTGLQTLELEVDVWQRMNTPSPAAPAAAMKRRAPPNPHLARTTLIASNS